MTLKVSYVIHTLYRKKLVKVMGPTGSDDSAHITHAVVMEMYDIIYIGVH